ncbi:M3 family oligoendopeptidase [Virgibacillus ihumii]|uniref:M3 family oligoendopeptidase n=1 Tax=Virgibacillus ihumii TaxID=2686091 RepID=UPI00157DBEDB|nr:M3 family oligoendopeptidase [Virgibacillus ihumii]
MKNTTNQTWNLESLYPGGKDSEALHKRIARLKRQMESLPLKINTVDTADIENIVHILRELQTFSAMVEELDDYVFCLYAVHVNDPVVENLMEESSKIQVDFETIKLDMDRLLAKISETEWNVLLKNKEVQGYQFYLEERKGKLEDKLPAKMEKLINRLSINGFAGWEDYYEQVMGNLRIPLEKDGQTEELSVEQAFSNAMFAENRTLRKNSARALITVCKENAETFKTVLNRISGYRLDTYNLRGWNNLLKEALDENRINEQSIRAMLTAIKDNSDAAQTYYKRKAAVMGLDKLNWYDTDAPAFSSNKTISYDEAANIIITQYHSFSEKLGKFVEKAFREGWIEAEDRKGKMQGGFCANMTYSKESRVFLTFRGTYQDVVTIAHELGHAYHNHILHDEPEFASQVSTSVAETASTFMENLVLDAAIDHAKNETDKLSLLEQKIINGLKYQVTVPAMFHFEQKLYEKRKQGLLTVEKISSLMENEFSQIYGDVLDETNPYEWITIPHLYDTEQSFYNFPYTVGYLFSNGIYALAQEQGSQFPDTYDEILRNTGRMTVEQLAETYLNKDMKEKEFWNAALQPVQDAIETYLQLTEKYVVARPYNF